MCMRASALSALLFILLGSVGFTACEPGEHDAALVRSLDKLVTALDGEDWSAVWELTDRETREELLQLHGELHGALKLVDTVVDKAEIPASRNALGSALVADLPVGSKDIGPRLLSRLFNASSLNIDVHAIDGLEIREVEEEGEIATLTTIVGEVFKFTRTDEGWRSLLVSDLLERSRLVLAYREHAIAVTERANEHRESWRSSQDPTTAHGTYNLALAALTQSPIDGSSLFAFLDVPARDALVKAIERSRVVQRSIQKRHKGAARVTVYKKRKMWHYVRAGSDRQLYSYWAGLPEFEPPFSARAAPVRVESAEDGQRAIVHTEDGGQVPLRKTADGFWKLADQEKRLLKLLWEPMDRAYERMARPRKFWKYQD
jgi:hypothetical protein